MLKRMLRWLLILVLALIVAVYFFADEPADRPPTPAAAPTTPAPATTPPESTTDAGPRNLSTDTFDAGVASGVHLVDFWAAWCGPCRTIAPTVEKLSTDYAGRATVSKLDVDANPEVAARFEITAIPTLIVFKDGEIVARILGVVPEAQLTEALDAALR